MVEFYLKNEVSTKAIKNDYESGTESDNNKALLLKKLRSSLALHNSCDHHSVRLLF